MADMCTHVSLHHIWSESDGTSDQEMIVVHSVSQCNLSPKSLPRPIFASTISMVCYTPYLAYFPPGLNAQVVLKSAAEVNLETLRL